LLTYRDYHSLGRGARAFQLDDDAGQCRVLAFAGARPYRLAMSHGRFTAAPEWYWNFWHRVGSRSAGSMHWKTCSCPALSPPTWIRSNPCF